MTFINESTREIEVEVTQADIDCAIHLGQTQFDPVTVALYRKNYEWFEVGYFGTVDFYDLSGPPITFRAPEEAAKLVRHFRRCVRLKPFDEFVKPMKFKMLRKKDAYNAS